MVMDRFKVKAAAALVAEVVKKKAAVKAHNWHDAHEAELRIAVWREVFNLLRDSAREEETEKPIC